MAMRMIKWRPIYYVISIEPSTPSLTATKSRSEVAHGIDEWQAIKTSHLVTDPHICWLRKKTREDSHSSRGSPVSGHQKVSQDTRNECRKQFPGLKTKVTTAAAASRNTTIMDAALHRMPEWKVRAGPLKPSHGSLSSQEEDISVIWGVLPYETNRVCFLA